MGTHKKSLVSALIAIAVTCIALAGALFVAPTFKTVIALETPEVYIDFSDSSDANYFRKAVPETAVWTVSDGVYKSSGYKIAYYKDALTIPAEGILYISFDFYAPVNCGAFAMGFTKNNIVENNVNTDGSPNGYTMSNTMQSSNAGLFLTFASSASNGGWLSSGMNLQGWIANDVNISQYCGAVHNCAIVCIDGNVSFEIDGNTVYGSSKTSSADLTDTVYLSFFSRTATEYIDNIVITNNLDHKYDITASDKDFSLLDKKGGICAHGAGDKAFFDQDVDIASVITSGQYERRSFYNGGYNLFGADYYTFEVNNQTGNYVAFALDFTEGNSSGYGAWWSSAEGMPYYMQYENGVVKQGVIKQFNLNRGIMTLPTGFEGRLIFPFTSTERMSWSANSNSVANFSDDESAINLSKICWVDVYYFETATCKENGYIKVANEQIWGDYIASVDNSANRVINAIKNIGSVTLASESQIAFARAQYDALTDKTAVTSEYVTLLTQAENTYASLADYSYMVGADGKNFAGTGGVTFGEVFSSNPSTLSAWVKVARNTADTTHVGTVIGNMERGLIADSSMYDCVNTFSFEITTNGNPKLIWRKARTEKAVFLVKNVDVRTGSYVNVTFVRDVANTQLVCYINGVAVATKTVTKASIADLTFGQFPVMVGSDYRDNEIISFGYHPDFAGYIADVSVYSTALSAEEVFANMGGTRADGLLGAIDFASGESSTYYDEVNTDATDAYGWKDVEDISELNLGDYTMAVLGDTQMMLSCAADSSNKSLFMSGYNQDDNVFNKNVKWLAANKDALNLKFVMHVGDLTDNLNYAVYQTKGATEMAYGLDYMNVLTEANIPWSLARGNHDGGYMAERLKYYDGGYYDDNGMWVKQDFNYTLYENKELTQASGTYTHAGYNAELYGKDSQRITNLINESAITEFGASDDNLMRNTYYKFTVGTQKWMVVTIDLEPSVADITWANQVITANPDYSVIITTHAYMGGNGNLITNLMGSANEHNNGQYIWDNLASKHANVAMVICGHASPENLIKTKLVGENGNEVWNFVIDESAHEFIGNKQYAPFVLLGFSDSGKTVSLNYYSAVANKLFKSVNQCTVEIGNVVTTDSDEGTSATWPSDTAAKFALPAISPYTLSDNNLVGTGTPTVYSQTNGWQTGTTWMRRYITIDIDKNGVFAFTNDACLQGSTCAISFNVYLTKASDGLSRIVYPANATSVVTSYYTHNAVGTCPLNIVGDINVSKGDKITVMWFGSSNAHVGTVKPNFDATIYSSADKTTALTNYSLGDPFSATTLQGLYAAGYNGKMPDGTASTTENYNGYTLGWKNRSSNNTYTLTYKDKDGNVLATVNTGENCQLPKIPSFDGYNTVVTFADNSAYVDGAALTSGNATVTVNFEKLPDNILIYDTDGKVAVTLDYGFTGTLPTLTRSGRIFLGYLVDGSLYKTYSYTGNEQVVKAVFIKFSTYNGASIRITNPSGVRFRTFVENDVLSLIGADNFAFGTIIAKAADITVNGVVDYSKLTVDTDIQHLDIVSTEEGQATVGNYLYFNGVIASVKANHYDWKWAGLGYMTVTYADGEEETYYAGVTDNARSISEIASAAYNDVRLVENVTHSNSVSGGYSAYDEETRSALSNFFGGND